jgi:enhancing lycopene biosynthesis protein 2
MTREKRIGVVLAGCGFLDGAEIQEACCTLLALDNAGVSVICMAPNTPQLHVVNHAEGAPADGESRNVLTESARIARGEVVDIASVRVADLDALIFPGGFGAAKNLSTFAIDGPDCTLNTDVERLILGLHQAGKPMGFVCIAPALAAKVLGEKGVCLTIGCDVDTAGALEAMGAKHTVCAVDDIVVDGDHKVVSTPAYMIGPSIGPVFRGIEKLVAAVLALA